MTPLKLIAAAQTNPGRVHPVDQDNAFAYVRDPELGRTRGFFIVADGMGGHQAGEIASKLAVDTIREELAWFLEQSDAEETKPNYPIYGSGDPEPTVDTSQLQQRLLLAINHANRTISQYALDNPIDAGNLGTTVTCALVDEDRVIIANIGDSRTYLLRDDQMTQITEDHSYVAHLVREGQIAPEDIFVHPRRNVITRSLGYKPEVQVDLWSMTLQPGDRLLLCSDGLWEMIQVDDLIARFVLEAETPAGAVEKLIDSANAHGGADNIGAVVVFIEVA